MKESLEELHDSGAIPDDEWSAAATIVIEQKRQETGIANWLPSLLNGRREFVERMLAPIEKSRAGGELGNS